MRQAQLSSDVPELEAPVEEVKELVAEAKIELEKTKPNLTKLKGYLSTIGAAITFAPKLKAAYEALKWAGEFVGVKLP